MRGLPHKGCATYWSSPLPNCGSRTLVIEILLLWRLMFFFSLIYFISRWVGGLCRRVGRGEWQQLQGGRCVSHVQHSIVCLTSATSPA